MIDHGYQVEDDPYCYKGTSVLKNKAGLRTQQALDEFEFLATASRFADPLPSGKFDISHYCAIHHHLFQDIFEWAGAYRTVRISKGSSMFCYPEFIETEMQKLFSQLNEELSKAPLGKTDFAKVSAHFLTELNAIHPFREGNGRTQLAFLTVLSNAVGFSFSLERTEPSVFLQAMIESFRGDLSSLEAAIIENLKDQNT